MQLLARGVVYVQLTRTDSKFSWAGFHNLEKQ